MEQNYLNQEAWGLLDEAAKHQEPTTKVETDQMNNLLNQAKEKAENPHEESFAKRHAELADEVAWANARHRTWSWAIIGGALLGICLLWWLSSSKSEDVDKMKQRLEMVKAWDQSLDTVITYESCGDDYYRSEKVYASPNKYKAYRLAWAKYQIEYNKECVGKADSVEYFTAHRADYEKKLREWEPKFDEINGMTLEKLQDEAMKDAKDDIKGVKGGANFVLFLLIVVIVLIPLYIWTGYPMGYEINASRTREKILTWVRKVGFGIAGFFFGAGLVYKFFSDDYSKSSSYNRNQGFSNDTGTKGANLVFKGILMLIGAVILAFVSIFIMLIEVIAGVKSKIRNRSQNAAA